MFNTRLSLFREFSLFSAPGSHDSFDLHEPGITTPHLPAKPTRLANIEAYGTAHIVFADKFGPPGTGPRGIVGRPTPPPPATTTIEKPDSEKTKQEIDDESALELARLLVGVALEEAQGRIERKIGRADEHDAAELRLQLGKVQTAMTMVQTQLDSPVALANREVRLRVIRGVFNYINDVPTLKKRYAAIVNPLARFLNIGTGTYISHTPVATPTRTVKGQEIVNLNRTPLEQFVGKSWEEICTLCGFDPREYQEAWYQGALLRATQGFDRGFVAAPTQTGKTFASFPLAAALSCACYPGKSILFVVKEQNVKADIIEGIRAALPGAKVGIIDADHKDFGSGYDVVVASMMTISRAQHLQSLNPKNYGVVATDEAMSLFAPTGKTVLRHLGFLDEHGAITPMEERFLFGMSADATTYSFTPVFGTNARLDEMDLPWYINKGHLHEPVGLHRPYRDVASDDWEVTTINGETYAYPKKKRMAIADVYRDWVEVFGRDAKIIVPWTRIADTIAAEAYFNMMEGKAVSYAYNSQRPTDENRSAEKGFQDGTGPRVIHATRGLAVGFRAKGAQGIIFPFQTDSPRLYGQWVGRLLGIHDDEPARQVRVVQKTGWNGGRGKKTAMTLARLLGVSDFHPADSVEYRPIQIMGTSTKKSAVPLKFAAHFVGNSIIPTFVGVAADVTIVCFPKRFPQKFKEALDDKFDGDMDAMAQALKLTPKEIDNYLTGQMPKEYSELRRIAKILAPGNITAFVAAWVEDFLELMAVRFPMNEWQQDGAVHELSRILRRQSLMAEYDEDGGAFASGLMLDTGESNDLGQLLRGEYLDNVGHIKIDWRALATRVIQTARELDDELLTDLLDRAAEEIKVEAAKRIERERRRQERLAQGLAAEEEMATISKPKKAEVFESEAEEQAFYAALNCRIGDLDLSPEIIACLQDAKIATVEQLIAVSETELLQILSTAIVAADTEAEEGSVAVVDETQSIASLNCIIESLSTLGLSLQEDDATSDQESEELTPKTYTPEEIAEAREKIIQNWLQKDVAEFGLSKEAMLALKNSTLCKRGYTLSVNELMQTSWVELVIFTNKNPKILREIEPLWSGKMLEPLWRTSGEFLRDDLDADGVARLHAVLSTPFKSRLARLAGLPFVGEWASLTTQTLLKEANLSPLELMEINRELNDLGLRLGMNTHGWSPSSIVSSGAFNKNLYKRIDSLDLSVRSATCLSKAGIEYIWQLVEKTEVEMLKIKYFGRKSLNELKEILAGMELEFGMGTIAAIMGRLQAQAATIQEAEMIFNENLFQCVYELNLSVRSANCLQSSGIEYIWQLVEKTEAEMLKTKNFGRKSLNEVKDILAGMGLHFGMRIVGVEAEAEARRARLHALYDRRIDEWATEKNLSPEVVAFFVRQGLVLVGDLPFNWNRSGHRSSEDIDASVALKSSLTELGLVYSHNNQNWQRPE